MSKDTLLAIKMDGFPLNKITSIIFFSLAVLSSSAVQAAEYEFDDAFLRLTSGRKIDVGRFKFGNPVEAGNYKVDVYLNKRFLVSDTVVIKKNDDDSSKVCLSPTLFSALRLREESLNEEALRQVKVEGYCVDAAELNPDIKATFSFADQQLNVEVPQALLHRSARGAVDPALWGSGVPAMILGYDANYYEAVSRNRESQSLYAGTRFGLNYDVWRFRHQGSLSWNKDQRRSYNAIRTYLERDITPLKSKLTLGDAFTDGKLFDTYSFRGVQMRTDDTMWPDSLRGYAPVVRGVAQTNARVEVWQNSMLLYTTTVNPGAFEINDLYPTGYGGDLEIRVHEADGSVNTFAVPYASVAQLLRPGMFRYDLMAGELRNFNLSFTPYVTQGTLQYGLNNGLTLYGGILGARGYTSGLVGSSVGTPIGAFAVDFTGARAWAKGQDKEGGSLRLTYSKFIPSTSSNVSVAAYRFSSSGYLDLQNGMKFNDYYRLHTSGSPELERQKSRLSLTLDQGLAEGWGQLYASGYIQDYWNKSGADTMYQLGYNNSYNRVNYSLSASRSSNLSGREETQYMLSLSVPLGRSGSAAYLSMDTAWQQHGGASSRMNISGQAGEENQLAWGVGANRDTSDNTSANASATYRTPYTSLKGSASKSDSYRSVSAGISGTAVVVADGVALSPYSGSTMAVIHAPGAGGAKVLSYSGVEVSPWGLAIVPYLRPYNMNTVGLDPLGLSEDIELVSTDQRVAPRTDSIMKVDFEMRKGVSVLVAATDAQGKSLPFGASVLDSKDASVGMVMQGGKVYARLPEGESILKVIWGEGPDQQCTIDIGDLLEQSSANGGLKQLSTQRCQ